MGFRAACLFAAIVAPQAAAAADPPLLSLSVGATDIFNEAARAAGDLRLEYRSGLSLLPFAQDYATLQPWAGLELTSRESIWAGGGIWLDVPLGRHWVLSPSFGAGYYDANRGKPLGSLVELRSQAEGGYVFNNGTRLVADVSHTSNAGITRHNAGTEAALLSYQIPLTWMAER